MTDFTFLAEKISSGAICVLPTDTVYGLVATTDQPEIIEKIYDMKGRSSNKPFIILISDISQLDTFLIDITDKQTASLNKLWPGPVSVILPCPDESFAYLHRGVKSLAFRVPDQLWLRELINKTGPIIATSANKSGLPLYQNINEIMKQLPKADFYIEGKVGNSPSRLAKIDKDGSIEWVERS